MHDVHPKWLSVRRLETVQLICSVSAYMYRLSSGGVLPISRSAVWLAPL